MKFNRRTLMKAIAVSGSTLASTLAAPTASARIGGRIAPSGYSLMNFFNQVLTPLTTTHTRLAGLLQNVTWYKSITLEAPLRKDFGFQAKAQFAYSSPSLDDATADGDISMVSQAYALKDLLNVIPGVNMPGFHQPSLFFPAANGYELDYTNNTNNYVAVENFSRYHDKDDSKFYAWTITCHSEGNGARVYVKDSMKLLQHLITFDFMNIRFYDVTPVNNIICKDTTDPLAASGYQNIDIKHIDGSVGGTFDEATKTITLLTGPKRKRFILETTLTTGVEKKPIAGAKAKILTTLVSGAVKGKNLFADANSKVQFPLTCTENNSIFGPLAINSIYNTEILHINKVICTDSHLIGEDPVVLTKVLAVTPLADSIETTYDDKNHTVSMKTSEPVTTGKKWGVHFKVAMGVDRTDGQAPDKTLTATIEWDLPGLPSKETIVSSKVALDSTADFEIISTEPFHKAIISFRDENKQNILTPILLVPQTSLIAPQIAEKAMLTSAKAASSNDISSTNMYLYQDITNRDPQKPYVGVPAYRLRGKSIQDIHENAKDPDWMVNMELDVQSHTGEKALPNTLVRAELIPASESSALSIMAPVINFNTNEAGKITGTFNLKGPDIVSKVLFKGIDDKVLAIIELAYAPASITDYLRLYAVSRPAGALRGSVLTLDSHAPAIIDFSVTPGNASPGQVKVKDTSLAQEYFTVNSSVFTVAFPGSAALTVTCLRPGKGHNLEIVNGRNEVISDITEVICQ